ncbi:hypothetical protein SAMN02745673_00861 [Marinactinospora thermotolerans DSM 45154]|uniref:Secreted protein n=1 Tax=Marinactinospora thermotolerans DSM 45154 TaxID=1122192 RepID=A0A1T4LXK2_9ACTN|nr:hypothetical protein SAMN02745673_00861 [Marinactinospora thermotolerans DSM 45154]
MRRAVVAGVTATIALLSLQSTAAADTEFEESDMWASRDGASLCVVKAVARDGKHAGARYEQVCYRVGPGGASIEATTSAAR